MTDTHELVPKAETLPVDETKLHPLVERMLAKDPTPETLEKIMDLQRRHEADLAKKAYDRALVGLKADMPPWIKHDKKVDYPGKSGRVQYTHASMAQVVEVVQPILTKHGFAINAIPSQENGQVRVTVQLKHRDGHQESASLTSSPDASGNKNPAQSIASTTTYLNRYQTCLLLGIATSDMNEPGASPKTAAPEAVDTKRNLRAVSAIKQAGKTREAAEKHVGKPMQEWTAADLETLKAWIKPEPKPAEDEKDVRVVGLLTPDQSEQLISFMEHHGLTKPDEMLELVQSVFEDVMSSKDLTPKHYAKLKMKMDKVKIGEVRIVKDGKTPIHFEGVEKKAKKPGKKGGGNLF